MDKFSVKIPKSVRKSLATIPLPWRVRIVKAIDALCEDPFIGEKMWGKLKDNRKIRIHPYRIVYRVDKKTKCIIIVTVGHRGGVYK